MTEVDLQDDATPGAFRLECWAPSDRNGARNTLGITGRHRRNLHFVWPATGEGAVSLTPAQLSMLTEGIDWRAPARTWQPEMAG